ncbi:hypothetical protein NF867_00540 [Solitalea sp. MAHUQ-68]|uniref:Uncharacterized protein n=1 Tax=Solitalea agri TaxID=2953739 RepID=A0A9X2EYK0_9SPHI|nr:hypothetical protein [Solitalea agri]MCO4291347.1 hypothetical protein [Solitalea agri]
MNFEEKLIIIDLFDNIKRDISFFYCKADIDKVKESVYLSSALEKDEVLINYPGFPGMSINAIIEIVAKQKIYYIDTAKKIENQLINIYSKYGDDLFLIEKTDALLEFINDICILNGQLKKDMYDDIANRALKEYSPLIIRTLVDFIKDRKSKKNGLEERQFKFTESKLLKWKGDKNVLIHVFAQLKNSTIYGTNISMLESSFEDIACMLKDNFDCYWNVDVNEIIKTLKEMSNEPLSVHKEFIRIGNTKVLKWNGDKNVLAHVFATLKDKLISSSPKITMLGSSYEDIAAMLRNNFDCYNDTTISTIVTTLKKSMTNEPKNKLELII